MAKMMTPAIEKFQKKYGVNGCTKITSPKEEAWRRFKRNKTAFVGLGILAVMVILAIFANFIAPYDYQTQIYADAYKGPSAAHLFGADNFGRDIFSRCVYGARYSLSLAVLCVIAAFMVGGALGIIAGFFGGRTDNTIMRIMDVFQSIPQVLMAIAITSALGNGIWQLVIAITISTMPTLSKNCRSAILNVKNADYVEASRAIGVGQFRMIMKHMIPNAVGVLTVFVVAIMSGSINMIASLSYLGIGLVPPTPEWGLILSDAKGYFTAYPYMVFFPAMMIMLTILAFNMLGDGLRDAFDPRLK
jgi:ABC-type dipeptide/oligopeptide/nickel transport system permease subunit